MAKVVRERKEVSIGLMICIFLVPMIFVWFLVVEGYSAKAKFFGFAWLIFCVLAWRASKVVLGVM